MKYKLFVILAFPLTILQAQQAPEKPAALNPEQQVIADQASVFEAAYNKGDIQGLAAMFAEDAEWVDSDGGVISGRKAIADMLEKAVKGGEGRSVSIAVQSVRAVTADVLTETGTSTVTEADGSKTVSSYSAVHVKKDGKWLVSQFTETGAPLAGGAALHLEDLAWLIGEWKDTADGIEVNTTVQWTPGGNQITRAYTVKKADGSADSGTEVICWDASIGKIRSFVFEADGGLSENTWTPDGARWLIQSRTVLPDGGQATAQHTMTRLDKDKYTWSSSNREIDGELLPNIDPVTIIRAK